MGRLDQTSAKHFLLLASAPHPIIYRERSARGAFTKLDVSRNTEENGFLCSGDSGGPLVTRYKGSFTLIGIASYIKNDKKFFPSACYWYCPGSGENFSNVSNYMPWIRSQLEKKNMKIECDRAQWIDFIIAVLCNIKQDFKNVKVSAKSVVLLNIHYIFRKNVVGNNVLQHNVVRFVQCLQIMNILCIL